MPAKKAAEEVAGEARREASRREEGGGASRAGDGGARDHARHASVAVQDAAGDRPDPRQGRQRGARAADVLEEARGEADREDAEVARSRTRSRRRGRRTRRSTSMRCT